MIFRSGCQGLKTDNGCVEGGEMESRGILEAGLNDPRMTPGSWPGDWVGGCKEHEGGAY